ncbi:hypothetical protein TCCBUS3UF1_2340 [Thermus sp. CCB_US3_UF1]|uniref:hypothetical protein n=1 Tax=Thermus sp. CCB_US3_UF1 TaxID=1111069 RepID=UPI0002389896|nr:hypothetical protein [Thermus sp. CCB_US3_UF1]AEV15283.1 hypothetical protein TCCBUS3UF1_2340 [Thermus sp. CCB_US3_UF1]
MAFLRVLEDPVLKAKQVKGLQDLVGVLQSRNQPLLIHGLLVPTEKQVEQVQQLGRELLKALQEEGAPSLELEVLPLERL